MSSQTSSAAALYDHTLSNASYLSIELWCYCRQPEDENEDIACDFPASDVEWFHVKCVRAEVAPGIVLTVGLSLRESVLKVF